MEMTKFTVVSAVLRNIYWSRNLIGPYRFRVISPGNSTSFTRPFLTGRRAWAGHKTSQTLTRKSGESLVILAYWVGANRPRNFWGHLRVWLQSHFHDLVFNLLLVRTTLPTDLLTVQHQLNMREWPDSLLIFVWESGYARLIEVEDSEDRRRRQNESRCMEDG